MHVQENQHLLIQVQRAIIVRLAESIIKKQPIKESALTSLVQGCKTEFVKDIPPAEFDAGAISNLPDTQVAALIADEFLADFDNADARSWVMLEAYYRLAGLPNNNKPEPAQ